jgi:hypothetical protein
MEQHAIALPCDPCPCGSGKPLVDCCYPEGLAALDATSSTSPHSRNEAVRQMILDQTRRDLERRRRYGEVRPIIHADWQGLKWVAVGEQVFSGQWRYFPDFLQHYIKVVLSPKWGNEEIAKPLVDRHPIMQWYDGMCRYQQLQPRDEKGMFSFFPDGCTLAYMLLSYDLFALRHSQSLQTEVVRRLKDRNQFQGARYELFVAATCLRAGFEIDYEDEADGSRKHPEFQAEHRKSRISITVEAKSRRRPGVLGQPGITPQPNEIRTRIGQLLNSAIQKAGSLPHVIFVDVNVPPSEQSPFEKPWFKDVMKSVQRSGAQGSAEDDLFNLIVFTNHPFHYVSPGIQAPPPEVISTFARNPRVAVKDNSVLEAIHDAAVKFGNVPQNFDDAE